MNTVTVQTWKVKSVLAPSGKWWVAWTDDGSSIPKSGGAWRCSDYAVGAYDVRVFITLAKRLVTERQGSLIIRIEQQGITTRTTQTIEYYKGE
jgi:hypothetical protein